MVVNRVYSKETSRLTVTQMHKCAHCLPFGPLVRIMGGGGSVRSGLLNPEEGVCLLCFINVLLENVNNYSDPSLDVQKLKISRVSLKSALQPPGT